MKTDYNKQANDFLHKYELNLSVREAIPQKKPLWCKEGEKHGINYYCSLVNKEGEHYGFDFWGSIADADKIKHGESRKTGITNYSILACLDTFREGESFEDFCNSYGYSTDSIMAEKTYQAVQEQAEGLKKVLSPEAIKELNEIY
jgi:hypothetical protein